MKRPVGVILTAAIALIGSLAILALAVFETYLFFDQRTRAALPPNIGPSLILAIVLFALVAAWGIATTIGLFLLRNWARISTIVFGVLLAFVSFLTAPMMFVVPKPPNTPPGFGKFMIGISVVYFLLGLMGLAWVFYFSRAGTKAVFAGAVESESVRPLSISIIGWVMLGSGLVTLPMAFLHLPLALFGAILGGWAATVGMLLFAVAYVLIGYGLLHLRPEARIAGIALFALFAVNGVVFSFSPDKHGRMLEAMKASPLFSQAVNTPTPPTPLALRLMIVPVMLVPLWFLVTRKKAFELPPAGGSAPIATA